MILSFLGILERVMKSLEKGIEVKNTSKDIQIKREVRPKLSSSPTRPVGVSHTKKDTRDAYRLHFRRFTYAQKDKKITYPMV